MATDFIGQMLDRIDNAGTSFSEQAYGIVGTEIAPLLKVMAVVFVSFYGLQLILGTSRISASEIVFRSTRVIFIVTLVSQWSYFNDLFYSWLNSTPEDVGRAILTAVSGTTMTDPTSGMSQIWEAANKVAATYSEQSGYFSVLPALIGILIIAAAAVLICVGLAILILSKVMMWVLIGTAPIGISLMLFPQTRNFGWSWFTQTLAYAMMPLFVYVIAAFILSALAPEVSTLEAKAAASSLQLSDLGAFVLLCLAGGFVLLNIQSMVQGITGVMAASIGGTAMALNRFALNKTTGASGRLGESNRNRTWQGAKQNVANSMQKNIADMSVAK
jgi:type IV secretion system protein VirB6